MILSEHDMETVFGIGPGLGHAPGPGDRRRPGPRRSEANSDVMAIYLGSDA